MAGVTLADIETASLWAIRSCQRLGRLWAHPDFFADDFALKAAEQVTAQARAARTLGLNAHDDPKLWSALYLFDLVSAGHLEPIGSGYGTFTASLHFALPGIFLEFGSRLSEGGEQPEYPGDWQEVVRSAQKRAEVALPVPADGFVAWSTKRVVIENRMAQRFFIERGKPSIEVDAGRAMARVTTDSAGTIPTEEQYQAVRQIVANGGANQTRDGIATLLRDNDNGMRLETLTAILDRLREEGLYHAPKKRASKKSRD